MVERTSATLVPMATTEQAMAAARKYVWWQAPGRSLAEPAQLLAQIMTLGTVEDVRWMLARVSREDLCAVLRDPPVGTFNGRSWSYWHRCLDQMPIPPLPTRTLPL